MSGSQELLGKTTETSKDRVQREAVKQLHAKNGHGIIAGATGVGKTKIAIDYITSLGDVKVLWVVPTTTLRDIGIPDEWSKWGHAKYFSKNVKAICYRSLHKETNYYHVVVLDEGHNITKRAYLGKTTFDRRYGSMIFLSATVPREKIKRKIMKHARLTVAARVSVDDAVDLGLVAPFKVHVIPVPMGKKNDFKVKTKDGKRYTTSEHNRYYALQNRINQFPRGKAPVPLYLARMHSIYRFKSKLAAARKLLQRLQGRRTLIFCGSIAVAESLADYTYHSKTDLGDYKAFNEKKIDH